MGHSNECLRGSTLDHLRGVNAMRSIRVVIVVASLLVTTGALSQVVNYTDSYGHVIGSAVVYPDSGVTQYRDVNGAIVGSSTGYTNPQGYPFK